MGNSYPWGWVGIKGERVASESYPTATHFIGTCRARDDRRPEHAQISVGDGIGHSSSTAGLFALSFEVVVGGLDAEEGCEGQVGGVVGIPR
jgi:hypothetical protein